VAPSAGGTQILGGEPRPAAPEPARPPRTEKARYAGASVAALALVAMVTLAMRFSRSDKHDGGGAHPPPPQAAGPAPAPTPAAPTAAERPAEPARTEPPAARPRRHDGPGAHALSPAAAADLDEADAALSAGKPSDAIRLAQHSLYTEQSSRAYAVIVRARCAQGDLGNAKAAFGRVDAGARAAVARACHALGVELR
jgi:hypothetical protein